MAKDITIYTTNTCAYCVMVKRWLQAKGMSYNEINLDENPDKHDDSREVVIGYNLAQLAPAVS